MKILDYGRSFLGSKAAFNSVRFWVESRARVVDERDGTTEEYYQCGACKSEDTFAKKNLFQHDNFDFTPIFGTHHTVIFRRKAWLNPNYRTIYPADAPWGGTVDHLYFAPQARQLKTNAAIVRATIDALPLVAQTEIWNRKAGLRVVLEYPVKTMNINKEKNLYQVDTGPVVYPDVARRHKSQAEAIHLAFVAFNAPQFADFVIEAPTAIRANGRKVAAIRHYSKIISLPAVNRLYSIG
jgi:hypothetical protein